MQSTQHFLCRLLLCWPKSVIAKSINNTSTSASCWPWKRLPHVLCLLSSHPYFSHDQQLLLSGWCRWLWLNSAHNDDEDTTCGDEVCVCVCLCVCVCVFVGAPYGPSEKRRVKSWSSTKSDINCVGAGVCDSLDERRSPRFISVSSNAST